jgi:hypothetical protein
LKSKLLLRRVVCQAENNLLGINIHAIHSPWRQTIAIEEASIRLPKDLTFDSELRPVGDDNAGERQAYEPLSIAFAAPRDLTPVLYHRPTDWKCTYI